MEFVVKSGAAEKQKTACLVVGVHKKTLPDSATAIDSLTEGKLSTVLKQGDLDFTPGHSLMLHSGTPFERLLLLGMGDSGAPMSEAELKKLATTLASALQSVNAREATIVIDEMVVKNKSLEWVTRQLVEAIEYAFYQFNQFKNDTGKDQGVKGLRGVKKVILLADRKNADEVKAGLSVGQAIGQGRNIARTLGNLPGNICHPTYLAEEAKNLAKQHAKLTTKILNEKQMTELGMSSLLSVSAGSDQEARLHGVQKR